MPTPPAPHPQPALRRGAADARVRRAVDAPTLRHAYDLFVVFSAFASPMWFNLLGVWGALALSTATTVTTLALWIASRRGSPPLSLRVAFRHPAIVYLSLAALSLLWSKWPLTSAATLVVQAGFVLQALVLVRGRSRRDLLRLVEIAAGAILALSVVVEIAVAVSRHPLSPNFIDPATAGDRRYDWVQGNLFDAALFSPERIQGIVGNANLLAVICVVAVVTAVLQRSRSMPVLVVRGATVAIAVWLCCRAGSAAMFVALVVIALVAGLVALRRRIARAERTRLVVAVSVTALLAFVVALAASRGLVLHVLGRDSTLTGRTAIWKQVLERANHAPVLGNGYASPWLPWDPEFSRWITDNGLTVFHAHNMWIDAYLQLGIVGVIAVGVLFARAGHLAWRAAVVPGAPRAALAPLLLVTLLLIQGMTESAPIMYWGLGMAAALATAPRTAPRLTASTPSAAAASR